MGFSDFFATFNNLASASCRCFPYAYTYNNLSSIMTSKITPYQQSELTDYEEDSIFFKAFNYAAIGMALVAPDGRWLRVNKSLCSMLGYSEEELLKKTFQDITHQDDLEQDLVYVNMMLAGTIDTYQMEKRYIHKEGNIINILLSVSLVHNKDGSPRFFISQIQDITQKKHIEHKLLKLSREDSLTGIANRRFFMELAEREMIRGRRFNEPQTLAVLDIDHFKTINDSYGHETGDKVLREMARECKRVLREVDVFGRIGGEEFAVLFLDSDEDIARKLTERLRSHIQSLELHSGGEAIRFTVSVGAVAFRGGEESLDSRLRSADQALYRAKQSGRNRIELVVEGPSDAGRPEGMLSTHILRLVWKDEYLSGNMRIDSQHRHLFTCANDLLNAVTTGQPDMVVGSIARELINHTVEHFQDEERIISEAGYAKSKQHSQIHRNLVRKMDQLITSFQAGRLGIGDMFSFLVKEVVLEHMVTEDRKFFSCLEQRGDEAAN